MELQEFMTTQVVSLEPQNTVQDAAAAMQKHNIGFIPVCNPKRHLVGIVTDRDIVTRGLANQMDVHMTSIADVMTKELVTAQPTTSIQEAALLMSRHQIRRLPVVQAGDLVGIVTVGDLATKAPHGDKLHVLSAISEPSQPMNV